MMPLSGELEMWGGVECTVNRVGDLWMDQLVQSGHDVRIGDLDLFAGLGLRTLRYPFLWERISPGNNCKDGWRWVQTRLARLHDLGIRPIAGLMHHGSGPPGICLTDSEFPAALAGYAGEFAARHPEVEDYTPVNEPLTTARFSGLYGIWYPHGTGDASFISALLNQCRGVVLSMRAIRRVNSSARLIQTEDMGRIFSTGELSEQADFENERRWLSLDLLCGRVTPGHGLWNYLLSAGATDREVLWFSENPCPPDIIGINHYALSNRYLDHRLENFPEHTHGGNGRQRYADTGAVRAAHLPPVPLDSILLEVWQRYRIPLAVTEAHLDCTREEQMRWLHEFWICAAKARNQGADVRAVTVWGLLGLHDWRSLLTRPHSGYESGVFDLSGGGPRPTALAAQVRSLAGRESFSHPVLEIPGWWRRESRVLCPSPPPTGSFLRNNKFGDPEGEYGKAVPVLILRGKSGLAESIARACEDRGIPWRLLDSFEWETDALINKAVSSLNPWAVIHTAECGRVEDPAPDTIHHVGENSDSVIRVAAACADCPALFLMLDGNFVAGGNSGKIYPEKSTGTPGRISPSLSNCARQVLAIHPKSLIVRAAAGIPVFSDFTINLINASLDHLLDGERGLWHPAKCKKTGRDFLRREPVFPCPSVPENAPAKWPGRAPSGRLTPVLGT